MTVLRCLDAVQEPTWAAVMATAQSEAGKKQIQNSGTFRPAAAFIRTDFNLYECAGARSTAPCPGEEEASYSCLPAGHSLGYGTIAGATACPGGKTALVYFPAARGPSPE